MKNAFEKDRFLVSECYPIWEPPSRPKKENMENPTLLTEMVMYMYPVLQHLLLISYRSSRLHLH